MKLFIICPTCGEWDQTHIDPACDECGGQRYVPLTETTDMIVTMFTMQVHDPGHHGGRFALDVRKGEHGLWYGTSPDVRGLLVTAAKPTHMRDAAVKAAAQLRKAREDAA